MLTSKSERLAAPAALNDGDRFRETIDPHSGWVVSNAGYGVLLLDPTSADTKFENKQDEVLFGLFLPSSRIIGSRHE